MLGKLNDKQADALLQSQYVGRIGCHADGLTYVVPVTYYYDGRDIICHSGEGMKIDMMRKNPEVCFEADLIHDMANWQSVVVWGVFEELQGEAAKEAMNKLVNHVLPVKTSATAHPHDPGNSSERRENRGFTAIIYRIKVREKTGRFEKG